MAEQLFPSIAFLWPAMLAASAGEMASGFAKQLVRFADPDMQTEVPELGWATPNRVVLELPSMRLRDFSLRGDGTPRLVCAPFALHCATIADFAAGHSLMAALRASGLLRLFLTEWRSATVEMRFFSIDTYLADLNVAVDELGGAVDLIGLCQGGWMALLFAARFPGKVRRLVLAGAPVDIGAGQSELSRLAASVPLAVFEELVEFGNGRILGQQVLNLWGASRLDSASIRDTLQISAHVAPSRPAWLEARFRDWHRRTVDLPGNYYLEVVEWLFKQNRLAEGLFVGLGRRIDLAGMRAPVFLIAARDDELVAPEQVFATAHRVGTPADDIRKVSAPCHHVGLFMGAGTLKTVWPEVARWLACDGASARPPEASSTDEPGSSDAAVCHRPAATEIETKPFSTAKEAMI